MCVGFSFARTMKVEIQQLKTKATKLVEERNSLLKENETLRQQLSKLNVDGLRQEMELDNLKKREKWAKIAVALKPEERSKMKKELGGYIRQINQSIDLLNN